MAASGTRAAIGNAGDWLSAQSDAFRVTGFRQGLKEAGYVEDQNLTIEYRWAEDHHDDYPIRAS
jgi:putative ABC transport system substrate-binding protein